MMHLMTCQKSCSSFLSGGGIMLDVVGLLNRSWIDYCERSHPNSLIQPPKHTCTSPCIQVWKFFMEKVNFIRPRSNQEATYDPIIAS